MLGLKLLVSGIAGITSISFFSSSLTIANKDAPNVWRVRSRDSFPILFCTSEKAKIIVSLAFEDSTFNEVQSKKIIFKGFEEKSQTLVDLGDTSAGQGEDTFQLTIFPSGKVQLGELGGDWSHRYGDEIICTKSVFDVTSYRDVGKIKKWENGLNKIILTLGDCVNKDGREECSINIGSDVGLKWKPEFTPKVII